MTFKTDSSGIGKLLTVFETTWLCGSTFWTVDLMKFKLRSSISYANLASELPCTVSVTCTPDFEDLEWKKL